MIEVVCSLVMVAIVSDASLSERRMEAVQLGGERGVERLKELHRDASPLVRRAVVRGLSEVKGEAAVDLLLAMYREDADQLVRRTAIRGLAGTPQWQELASRAMSDPSELVRLAVVEHLSGSSEKEGWASTLLEAAVGDSSLKVSQLASRRLWPYHAPVVSAREKPEFQDLQLSVVNQVPIPLDGWRFAFDAQRQGHLAGWQEPEFDDESWSAIRVGQPWQNFGHRVEGVAWYRLRFTLPTLSEGDAIDLVFEAVDERAWIWVNGSYLGGHDVGPAGWDRRFALDVESALKPGAENVIAVRVEKPAGDHGGIWKPLYLEILKK